MAQRLLHRVRVRATASWSLARVEDLFARSSLLPSIASKAVHHHHHHRNKHGIVSRCRYFHSKAEADGQVDEDASADQSKAEADGQVDEDASADGALGGETREEDIHNAEDLHEDATQKTNPIAFPAAWRDPGLWVDLELDRAGLLEGTDSEKLGLQSPWGSKEFPHPDLTVLFPHPALNDHRSRPFVVPRGDKAPEATAAQQLESNRKRLTALWRLSNSHGISWDELDHAYVTFAKSGKRRYDEWARRQSESDPLPLAAKAKKHALERAKHRVARFVIGHEDPLKRAVEYYPSRIKRLAARYYANEKKRRLDPWKPGRLTAHLQQLVVARMLRRETAERACGFRSPGNDKT